MSLKRLTLDLGQRSYAISISEELQFATLRKDISDKSSFIITDSNVAPLYLEKLKAELSNNIGVHIIDAGEASKSMLVAEKVHGSLIEAGADRSTVCLALGGGVVGDLAGFIAATFMRGIPFIQLPTSLLAMVDSSVGGKVAVNHPLGKNMIGNFYQPKAVHIACNTLSTLPKREVAAGVAEVIKYGILGDSEFFNWLEKNLHDLVNLKPEIVSKAVEVSVLAKADIVAKDETETSGVRALLNLGHTFGHAEEVLCGYGEVLHGEAVAAGMLAASKLSMAMGKMKKEEVDRVENILTAASLPTKLKASQDREAFWKAMQGDKKSSAGQVYFIIPNSIGDCALPQVVERDLVESILD